MSKGWQIINDLKRTILHFFPTFFVRLNEINDCRDKSVYEIAEIVFGAIMMYIFKEGSRNAFNNDRAEKIFRKNYYSVFKKALPHMDTVNDVFKVLDEDELESLKLFLIKELIVKKVLNKFRIFGKYHHVAVDATGVMNVKEGHCDHCLHKTSKKSGKTTYFHNVLEAKLIGSNGFALSIGTEWIENTDDYDKQDCEHKAFGRLAERLAISFPKLPVCILADGLYPNATFFKICRENDWHFIVTLKDGNLKSVWEELSLRPLDERRVLLNDGKITQDYKFTNGVPYKEFTLNWCECIETEGGEKNRFVYVTDLPVDYHSVTELVASGRMRFGIEDSFNTQKRRGYEMSKKFSRSSYRAMKNFYSTLQIAHIINQLLELGSLVKALLTGPTTLKHLWKQIIAAMYNHWPEEEETTSLTRLKIRFE